METEKKTETMETEKKVGKEQEKRAEKEQEKITKEESQSPKSENIGRGKQKKSRIKWIFLGVAAVLLAVGTAVYVRIGIYYQTHFFPNTVVNDIAVGNMDAAQASALLDAVIQGYTLEVTGREPATAESGAVLGTVASDAVRLTYADSENELAQMIRSQKWMAWIKPYLAKEPDYVIMERGAALFDEQLLEDTVEGWAACRSENMAPARDAYIAGPSAGKLLYEVVPETKGTWLDVDQAILLIGEALRNMEETLDLEEAGVYEEPAIRRDDTSLTAPVETANRWLGTKVVYDWHGNEVVLDAETLQNWITIEDGEAVLDEDAVKSFVKSCSKKYDTYGKDKSFVTTLGVKLKLSSASYGWRTDTEAENEELLSLILQGSSVSRAPVYSHKGMIKVADSVNDIGDTYVEADLTNQHLYLYQDGQIVLETDFVSGKISNGSGTPAGIFGITYKTTDAVLRGRDYETPVKYWMPFYGNYGMHDAGWRRNFGGDIFLNNGSHGCINLPPSMAAQIYQHVYTGFPVICYYYEHPIAPEGVEELPDPETAAQAEVPGDAQPVVEQ